MKKNVLYLFLTLLLTDGCVDPLQVAIPEVGFQLVVDGYITNEPGPYTIKLYRARPLQTDLDQLVPEKFAKVTIYDDLGTKELLNEVSDGVYRTSIEGIKGEVGRKYRIEINTITGKRFSSEEDELRPVGAIDRIYYEWDGSKDQDGFRVYVDAKGVPEENDLIRFRMVGTYEVETFPQLRTRRVEGGVVPDPFPCSGYGVNQSGQLTRFDACSCCICWVNQFDDIPTVADERFELENEFNGIQVGFVPINRRTFHKKFRVEVQQMSLSDNIYEYWRLVRAQKLGTTDLFQPPGGRLIGNIRAADPAEQSPLGIFWAAGVAKKAIVIEKSALPNNVLAIDTLIAPCQFLPYSTNQRPSFW